MKIIAGRRQSGKTTKLVEMVKDDPQGIYIAANKERCAIVRKQFNLPRNKAYTFTTLTSGSLRAVKPNGKDPVFYIDDYDVHIRMHTSAYTKIIVINDESIVWGSKELEIKI